VSWLLIQNFLARLEYQSRPSISGMSSFKNLLAKLPPRVHSVYYRDEIGNISSSHLRTDSHKVQDFSTNIRFNISSFKGLS
jgi:hypothetical protein